MVNNKISQDKKDWITRGFFTASLLFLMITFTFKVVAYNFLTNYNPVFYIFFRSILELIIWASPLVLLIYLLELFGNATLIERFGKSFLALILFGLAISFYMWLFSNPFFHLITTLGSDFEPVGKLIVLGVSLFIITFIHFTLKDKNVKARGFKIAGVLIFIIALVFVFTQSLHSAKISTERFCDQEFSYGTGIDGYYVYPDQPKTSLNLFPRHPSNYNEQQLLNQFNRCKKIYLEKINRDVDEILLVKADQ